MMKIIPLPDTAEPYRAPDLVWSGAFADLAINPPSHALSPGDLRAEQGLATQVLICLMTDRRVDAHELPEGVANRGWIGDSFDTGPHETPIGSRLWLLRQLSLIDGIEVRAETYAVEALQPLIDQGAVVRATAAASADRAANRLDLSIALYGRDGGRVFFQKFEILWRQIDGVDRPLSR